jgi:hypothetical protein
VSDSREYSRLRESEGVSREIGNADAASRSRSPTGRSTGKRGAGGSAAAGTITSLRTTRCSPARRSPVRRRGPRGPHAQAGLTEAAATMPLCVSACGDGSDRVTLSSGCRSWCRQRSEA